MLAEQGLESTLLKVGHHGSMTSTGPEFLARVAPQWAVISCGLHNRYGHPREEVLAELQAAHVRTFSTDINGASCFELDGNNVKASARCGMPDRWQRICNTQMNLGRLRTERAPRTESGARGRNRWH